MRGFSKAGALAVVAALAAALVAGGCGGSSSASTGVDVKTGSLSKAQFVKRANTICASVRTQFLNEFSALAEHLKPQRSAADEEKFRLEALNKLVLPNYEKRMIGQIAALGAPAAYASEVGDFLEALKQRLGEIREEPKRLTNTAFPFASAAKAAEAANLKGCASSFG